AHDGHVGVTGLTVEPRHVDLTIDDQAIALRFSRGSLTVREREVTFNDLAMSIGHEGEAHGDLDLTGGYGLGDAGGLTLKGEWRGGRFDSPVVFEALRLGGSTDQADRFTRMAPSGAFDATFVYASAAGDRTRSFDLGVRPRTLAITLAGDRLAASLGSASLITIRPDEVIFHDVEGLLGGDQFAVEGRLSTRGTLAADLAVTYLADGLSPELRSVLPASVSDLIDALDVRTSEPIHIMARPLSITEMRDADGVRRWRTTFTGGADVAGASFEAGLPFADVDAHLDITVVAEHGAPPQLSVQIDAASLRVSNRLMTSASARLTLLARPDVLELRDAIGMMYGGQITAEADVGVGADDAYTVRTRLAGVDLAEFAAADPAADPDSRARRAQGEMDGRLSISGLRGQPESMIGEGAVRLHRGDLGGEPLAMLMLHLVQIAPPIGGIETADVDFYISGRTAELEHIALEGPSMTLKGRGTLALDDWSIRARLDSRGRVALLSDLVAGLSGGLFSIEVTGTLADPSARLIALPGLSRPGIAATPPLVRENPDDQ
ncbi:MAG: hypothetical protein KDA25_01880, partial [Phycisphaerales bacterium]|nr:hypothetical protein [Phycisphaerales bacterium]